MRLKQKVTLLINSYCLKASVLAAKETYNNFCKPLLESFTMYWKKKKNSDKGESDRFVLGVCVCV